MKMKVSAGDHLFVDRLTYNFRKPERGEIIVFETKGIQTSTQCHRMSFTSSGWSRCPAKRCRSATTGICSSTAGGSTPQRRILKMFMALIPTQPPRESQYSGHVNGTVAQKYDLYPNLAPIFPDAANRLRQ